MPSAYHRTKFDAERIVREQATAPWRVYRPAVVMGQRHHSRETQRLVFVATQGGQRGRDATTGCRSAVTC